MRVVIAVLVSLLLLSSVHAAMYDIEALSDHFQPANLTINSGDSVRFTNRAGVRTIVFSDDFKTGALSAGTAATRSFNQTGTMGFQVENDPALSGMLTIVESGASPPPPPAEELTAKGQIVYVAATDYEFQPAQIEVMPGDTVVWENLGSVAHSVDFFDNPNEAGVINGDQTYNRTFLQPGTYDYRCRFHNAMKGRVTVIDPAQAAAQTPVQDGSTAITSEDTAPPTTPVESTAPAAPTTPPSDIQNEITQLRAELLDKIKNAGSGEASAVQGRIDTLSTTVSNVQSRVETQGQDLNTLKTRVSGVERLARNPPQVEMPATTSPWLVYFSLLLSLCLAVAVIGLGVYVMRRPKQSTATPPAPTGPNPPSVAPTKPPSSSSIVKAKADGSPSPSTPSSSEKHNPSTTTVSAAKGTTAVPPNIKTYLQKCRSHGLNDAQIIERFVKSGWSKEKAEQVVKHS